MGNGFRLLVVDDDEQYQQLITDVFEDEFELKCCSSGFEALDIFESYRPHIVLMDINMPNMSGLETCKNIKDSQWGEECAIIFISGHNTLDEKLNAYNAGGDDFISKPFEMKELYAKLERVSLFVDEKRKLEKQEKTSRSAALESMQEASEYGYIMQFFKNMSHCESSQDIAIVFFNVMKSLGLHCSIQLRGAATECFCPQGEQMSPIEQNIYELLQGNGRLYEFGQRMMVNDKHVSFLIKNVPENPTTKGRLRDIIAVMSEGLEEKHKDLSRSKALSELVSGIAGFSNLLTHQIAGFDNKMAEVFNDILTQISGSFHVLDLSEEQEAFLSKIVEKGIKQLDFIQQDLRELQQELEAQTKVAATALQKPSKPHQIQIEQQDDIELF